jgi:hypothetical protein
MPISECLTSYVLLILGMLSLESEYANLDAVASRMIEPLTDLVIEPDKQELVY